MMGRMVLCWKCKHGLKVHRQPIGGVTFKDGQVVCKLSNLIMMDFHNPPPECVVRQAWEKEGKR